MGAMRAQLTKDATLDELQALLNELYLRFVTLYSTGEQLLRQLRAIRCLPSDARVSAAGHHRTVAASVATAARQGCGKPAAAVFHAGRNADWRCWRVAPCNATGSRWQWTGQRGCNIGNAGKYTSS